MKLPGNYKLITDPVTGRQKLVPTINKKLDTSAQIRQKTSKRARVVSPNKAGLKRC